LQTEKGHSYCGSGVNQDLVQKQNVATKVQYSSKFL